MFSPEKISPDSLLEGEYMLDGMFVFFISSLSLHRLFPPPFPLPPLCFLWWFCFSRASPFDLLPLFISLCLPLISSHQFFSFLPFSLLHRCQCSVSCGGGVQTRTIQCLRQGRPAAGCLPYQRPITSRACNTQFCPPAPPAPAQSPGRVVTAGGSTLKGKFICYLTLISFLGGYTSIKVLILF